MWAVTAHIVSPLRVKLLHDAMRAKELSVELNQWFMFMVLGSLLPSASSDAVDKTEEIVTKAHDAPK